MPQRITVLAILWFVLGETATYALRFSEIPLQDSGGKRIRIAELRSRYFLISFFYSHCRVAEMCPRTIALTKQVHAELRRVAKDRSVKFLLVSLNPESDSPEVLTEYRKKQKIDPDWTLLTGKPKNVEDFAAEFNVAAFPVAGKNAPTHNAKTILLDEQFKLIKAYKENEWQPRDIVQEIR